MQAVAGLRLRLYGVTELYIAPLLPQTALMHSCAFLVLSLPTRQITGRHAVRYRRQDGAYR